MVKTYRAPAFDHLDLPDNSMGEPWERPLARYIGVGMRIYGGKVHVKAAAEAFEKVKVEEKSTCLPQNKHPDIGYHLSPNKKILIIRHEESGEILGALGLNQMPFVKPEHRGKGYGSFGLFLLDTHVHRSPAIGYSPEGLANRAAVHKHHVNAALARGDVVPEIVLRDYVFENGSARLREPYTTERHWKISKHDDETRERRHYEAIADLMLYETHANVERDMSLLGFLETRNVQVVSRLANENPDWKILKTKMRTKDIYAVFDTGADQVIDAFGIRPRGAYREELKLRLGWGDTLPEATTLRNPQTTLFRSLSKQGNLAPVTAALLSDLEEGRAQLAKIPEAALEVEGP